MRKWRDTTTEDYVYFNTKDKVNTLSRMCDYAESFAKSHNISDPNITRMIKRIRKYFNDPNYKYIYLIMTTKSVADKLRFAAWVENYISENKIKDRKALNRCWEIRCVAHFFSINYKCQGA